MPPLPFVPGVIRFTVEGSCGANKWANLLHWGYTGAVPTGPNLVAFCSTLEAAWGTNFAPLMGTGDHIEKCTAVDLSSASGAAGEFAASLPGSRAGGLVPASTCVLVTKTVARRYRGGHPRSYICAGVVTDLDSASLWDAGFAASVQGAYQAVQTAMDGTTQGTTTLGPEAVVSYVDKALNPVSPFRRAVPLVLNVLSVAAETAIAIQRRRIGR